MKNNKDIRSFFQPRSQTPAPCGASPSSSSLSDPPPEVSQTPSTPNARSSSPVNPQIVPKTPRTVPKGFTPVSRRRSARLAPKPRTEEIGDSEDDSFSEDDSLPDLFANIPKFSNSSVSNNPGLGPRAKKPKTATSRQEAQKSLRALLDDEKQYKAFKLKADIVDAKLKTEGSIFLCPQASPSSRLMISPRRRSTKDIQKKIVQRTLGNCDAEQTRRAERAMKNVGAADTACAWYFFNPDNEQALPTCRPFPQSAPQPWQKLIGDEQTRGQNLGSGLPERFARKAGMPTVVFNWMLDQMICDPSPFVRMWYPKVLLAHLSRPAESQTLPVTGYLGCQTIYSLFEHLGPSCDLRNHSESLEPVAEASSAYLDRSWSLVISTLDFFTCAIPYLHVSCHVAIALVVMRMFADDALMGQPRMLKASQSVLRSIAKTCPDGEWENSFLKELFLSCSNLFKDSYLQARVLSKIPLSTMNRLMDLRRRMAAIFLFQDLSFAEDFSLLDLDDMSHRLRQKDMKVSSNTDYEQLFDLVRIWEITLQGIPPPSSRPSPSSPSTCLSADGTISSPHFCAGKLTASTTTKITGKSLEEQIEGWDRQVDELVTQIEFLRASIKGGDAAHVIRFQIREYLMELSNRLPFTIRTVPPQRKDHFDLAREATKKEEWEAALKQEEERKRQSGFMSRFLASGTVSNLFTAKTEASIAPSKLDNAMMKEEEQEDFDSSPSPSQ